MMRFVFECGERVYHLEQSLGRILFSVLSFIVGFGYNHWDIFKRLLLPYLGIKLSACCLFLYVCVVGIPYFQSFFQPVFSCFDV